MEMQDKTVCWRSLGDKANTQSSTQTDHFHTEALGSKSMVASYKDMEAQTDSALNKHKGIHAALRT